MSFDLERYRVFPEEGKHPDNPSEQGILKKNPPDFTSKPMQEVNVAQGNEEPDLEQYSGEEPFQNEQAGSLEEPFDLSKYIVEEEGPIESGVRQAGQYSMRALENFLGLPDSLAVLAYTGLEKAAEGITGQELAPGLKKFGEKFKGNAKTPQKWREMGKTSFGQTLEPKNKTEEDIGEIASDVGAFLNPIGGLMSPVKAIGLSLVGKGAKEASKLLTKSEGKQDAAKIGAMFLTDLLLRRVGGQTANNFINGLYETERRMVPQGTRAIATDLENTANDVINRMNQTHVNTASSRLVRTTAQEVLQDVQNGTADVHGLLTAKRRLNEIRGDPSFLRHEEPVLNELSRAVEQTLEDYGHSVQANPEFYRYHVNANEAYSTMAQSRTISNFIGRNLPRQLSHFALTLFGEAISGHTGAILPTVGAAAAIKSGELLYRVMASPNLRRFYLEVLSQAGAQNARGVANAIAKLDKEMKKEFGEE